jgi:hypothetical protein
VLKPFTPARYHSLFIVIQPLQLSTAMKVTIRKWNAVATWRWDIPEDDVCGICQVHFDGTCPSCKYPGDDCSLCRYSAIMSVASFESTTLTLHI